MLIQLNKVVTLLSHSKLASSGTEYLSSCRSKICPYISCKFKFDPFTHCRLSNSMELSRI